MFPSHDRMGVLVVNNKPFNIYIMKKITEKKLPIVAKLVSECLEGKILRFSTDLFLTHNVYSGQPQHGESSVRNNRIYLYNHREIVRGNAIVKYLTNMNDVFQLTRLYCGHYADDMRTLNLKNLLNNYSNGAEAFELALQIKTEKS